jgi:hypothetical protein
MSHINCCGGRVVRFGLPPYNCDSPRAEETTQPQIPCSHDAVFDSSMWTYSPPTATPNGVEQWAGYTVEFAHLLASRMNITIAWTPIPVPVNPTDMLQHVASGAVDSSLSERRG